MAAAWQNNPPVKNQRFLTAPLCKGGLTQLADRTYVLTRYARNRGLYPHMKNPRFLDCPSLCGQHKKPPCRKYSVLSGVTLRQRRHSCFCLDALIVVKVNVSVD